MHKTIGYWYCALKPDTGYQVAQKKSSRNNRCTGLFENFKCGNGRVNDPLLIIFCYFLGSTLLTSVFMALFFLENNKIVTIFSYKSVQNFSC